MREVLNHYRAGIEASDILQRLRLEAGKFFLVSVHREENVDADDNFRTLAEMLNAGGRAVSSSCHRLDPSKDRKRVDAVDAQFHTLVRLVKPLGFRDYNKLQQAAKAVLSDSGTISEESAILGFQALNIRDTHERPEAMEEAAVMMVGIGAQRVLQGLAILDTEKHEGSQSARRVADYEAIDVSGKVVRIIQSYVDLRAAQGLVRVKRTCVSH